MIDKKIRIFLFIPSLTAGGAEKVMLFIAKNLDKTKFEVKLIIIGFEKETIYDTSGVELVYLNYRKVKYSMFKILKLFFIYKPDIVFGSLRHINESIALISYIFPKTICMARETFVLSARNEFKKRNKKIFNILGSKISYFAYKRINCFICQSEDMRNDLVDNNKYKRTKILTINNPLAREIKTKNSIPNKNNFHFITVGRLVKNKGYERIIDGLSKLDIPFTYTIIGSGIEKERIFALARQHNIFDKIKHIPMTKNVYKHLSDSHIYLQGSYYEGFPNALVESLGVGTPAIVYEAPGGMNEIIIDGENGFIVKNNEEFKDKLKYILKNLNSFKPNKVASHSRTNFGAKKIIKQYETLFENFSR